MNEGEVTDMFNITTIFLVMNVAIPVLYCPVSVLVYTRRASYSLLMCGNIYSSYSALASFLPSFRGAVRSNYRAKQIHPE